MQSLYGHNSDRSMQLVRVFGASGIELEHGAVHCDAVTNAVEYLKKQPSVHCIQVTNSEHVDTYLHTDMLRIRKRTWERHCDPVNPKLSGWAFTDSGVLMQDCPGWPEADIAASIAKFRADVDARVATAAEFERTIGVCSEKFRVQLTDVSKPPEGGA